jgi:hypothetical protein
MTEERRENKRDISGLNVRVTLEIQDGFRQERMAPEVTDFSRTGISFSTFTNPAVVEGALVVVQVPAGDGQNRVAVNGKITWVRESAGKTDFACVFDEPLDELPKF